MSFTLEMPIQYFPDSEKFGNIGLGTLYVGVVNGDPEANPADRIQVYVSRQSLPDLPISQPITLSAGGVPTYQGSPVTLKVDSSYSMAVLDYLGAQVYYCASAGEEIDKVKNDYTVADVFNCTGLTNVFTLSYAPASIYSLDIDIDGASQSPNLDYALSDKTLTMTSNPPDKTLMTAKYATTAESIAVPALSSSVIDAGNFFSGSTVEDVLAEIGVNSLTVAPEMFGATGDGVTDDTAALQAAINACSLPTARAKTITLTGNKKYRILGTLLITAPIQIIGQTVYDIENTRGITIPAGGEWFIHANTTGPLFRFNSNLSKGARLEKFAIFQEGHSAPGVGWVPAIRDWVIRNENTQGTLHIDGVHFHNVHKGVLTDFAVRPRYKNITGQFFYRAFSFDRIYDIGTFVGLHEWTYWSEADSVIQYTQANAIGVTFLRTDGMWVDEIFTFGITVGLYSGVSPYGGTGRVIEVGGLYCDFTGRAVVIDASAAHIQISKMFHLGQAWPAVPTAAILGACAVHVSSGSNSLVQIGQLYSVISETSAIKVEGTANQVWIGSEIIEQFDFALTGQGAHYIPDASNTVKIATIPSVLSASGTSTALTSAGNLGVIQAPTQQKIFGASNVNKPVTAAGAAGAAGVVTVEGEANASLSFVAPSTGFVNLGAASNALGFYGGSTAVKGTVTGAKAGNAALASLITYLAARGLLTDSTT